MSDLIGTVRREDRAGGGHSLWQLISTYERGADWVCVYSTERSNSESDPEGFGYTIERWTKVIGAVPGTPAAEAQQMVPVGPLRELAAEMSASRAGSAAHAGDSLTELLDTMTGAPDA